ncbi:hypothetical protein AS9A_1286 [Hoyosella subflava DQS3-9A1]|uniref:Uncharacterized protein n=1 Tax=Hoyosella subflava (strain DSM 45089 / JCM 17490 / NBRC 109087 / DQS3-9A1) TaxID=443218 RepID=F6EFC5_HOYSD|nr:hypothetical protein AS9A_1286 [Hoyosella subflava DQS3-9A1]
MLAASDMRSFVPDGALGRFGHVSRSAVHYDAHSSACTGAFFYALTRIVRGDN